ncbi:MAG: ABC transporter ATP-binding protein [Dehalococcoidales bacterium]|nr:ABC transporter ATP-binding protein [Dehalococcoidales bacterium]
MDGLTLKKISKRYKKTGLTVLRNIDLEVASDEFLVILGPSGCGKTTLLRIIAGLETPTEGEVLIDGQPVNDLDPQDRGIGMVFQNYALYPHMTVHGNLAFNLKTPWYKKAERKETIERIAEKMDIRRHFDTKPYMLSGGERQRVAMGRAMINECRLYLLDEPLSNLDDNLRSRLRPEILRLFHQEQAPFLYVTHDQTDAMTMGTRIAVMKDGVIQQLGTPDQIHSKPANMFVAGFVGTPKINFIPAEVAVDNAKPVIKIGDLRFSLSEVNSHLERYAGKQVVLGIRPEDILTSTDAASTAVVGLESELRRYEYLGNKVHLYVDFNGTELCIAAPSQVRARLNQAIAVFPDSCKIHLFDPETELRLKKDSEQR